MKSPSVTCVTRSHRGARVQGAAQSSETNDGGSLDFTRTSHNNGYIYNPDMRRWLPLGQATISDFQAAIAWHERQIDGHQNTIAEYREYIDRIKDAGVTCLDEIG
jgi:hypothetical protein